MPQARTSAIQGLNSKTLSQFQSSNSHASTTSPSGFNLLSLVHRPLSLYYDDDMERLGLKIFSIIAKASVALTQGIANLAIKAPPCAQFDASDAEDPDFMMLEERGEDSEGSCGNMEHRQCVRSWNDYWAYKITHRILDEYAPLSYYSLPEELEKKRISGMDDRCRKTVEEMRSIPHHSVDIVAEATEQIIRYIRSIE